MEETPAHLERIRSQFTRQADAYARMQQTADEAGLELLAALAGAGAESRVLDVACGPGFLTLAFADRCAEVVGFDATPVFVERASAEAARCELGNVTFQTGDAEALPFGDASFDLASCRAAFHHFPRPARVLSEMARVVRPGGRLLVADMLGSEDAAKAELHDRIERLCDPTHERALPASEFAALFAAANLTVVHDPKRPLHYEVEEWIAHGGPEPAVAREIVTLLEASLDEDRTGLDVRREEGRLLFSHMGAAFVLEVPR